MKDALLTPKARAYSLKYQAFIDAGWTDAQLIEYGFMRRRFPANNRECLIGRNRTMRKRFCRDSLKPFNPSNMMKINIPVDPIKWKRMKREAYHQHGMRGPEFNAYLCDQYGVY